MLEILIEKKLLFPLILFVAVYAAIEISYYRGHAAGIAEEKEKQEKMICRDLNLLTEAGFSRA